MSGLQSTQNAQVVKELQKDLARKYRIHASKIETYWRSFNRQQREKCIKAGAADGAVLKTPSDRSMGNVCKIIPEWNLRDLCDPRSDLLLDLLKHRATTNVHEQYITGLNGQPGDCNFIWEMMATKNLRYAEDLSGRYELFLDENQYGMGIKLAPGITIEQLPEMVLCREAGALVTMETGELILMRQMYLLQGLTIIIDDILEEGSTTRTAKKPTKKETPPSGQGQVPRGPAPKKLTVADLISITCSQRDSADEYLKLLSTEPVVLAHAVNFAFFSRPELVPDVKGRSLPAHTDRYISPAFFDAIHTSVQTAAVWNYLGRLLEYLGTLPKDKAPRVPVLQEIANICNLEYSRAQGNLKRTVQTGIGLKCFKRFPDSYDNAGNARVSLKGDPANLARGDKQLQFMLRLCQAETTASKAIECVKGLAELHEKNPNVRDTLDEREYNALFDLFQVVNFIQEITPVIAMPSVSRKNGQQFITKTQELEAELSQLKQGIDLLDYALPIDNLLEPGMADGALKALDDYIIEKTGTKLGFLYQDAIDHCLASIQQQCQQELDKIKKPGNSATAGYIPFPESDADRPEVRVEQRRQKLKTRPVQSTVFEIAPPLKSVAPALGQVTEEMSGLSLQTFKVSAATAGVFSALFEKSKARGSVAWSSFESALAELKFSVIPKFGSVYTFSPPESMAVTRSFTVHRPHSSRIEGYLIPIYARRLNRLYGWGEKTFVVA